MAISLGLAICPEQSGATLKEMATLPEVARHNMVGVAGAFLPAICAPLCGRQWHFAAQSFRAIRHASA